MRWAPVVDAFLLRMEQASGSWAERALPGASFMHGHAGLAFFYAEHARLTGTRGSLDRAREHVVAARRMAESSLVDAFGSRAGTGPFRMEDLAAGVFTGWAGVGYATTIVGAAAGDDALISAGEGLFDEAFARHALLRPRLTELFAGTAGYVAASDDLARRGLGSKAVRDIGEAAARMLVVDVAVPVAKGGALGAAHGRTGELMVLVRGAPHAAASVRAAVDELRGQGKSAGSCLLWPVSRGMKVPGWLWSSFCNGAVGQALLFTDAFAAYGDVRYREAAAGAVASLRSLETVPTPSLCCGEAGQAIAIHGFGALVASDADRRAGRSRLEVAIRRAAEVDAQSLFQGHAGVAWVAMLAAARRPLRMPMFSAAAIKPGS